MSQASARFVSSCSAASDLTLREREHPYAYGYRTRVGHRVAVSKREVAPLWAIPQMDDEPWRPVEELVGSQWVYLGVTQVAHEPQPRGAPGRLAGDRP